MRQNSKANILIRDSIADSKSWFDDFDKVKTKIGAPPEGRRIKIAVLDTGIDMGNSFFSNLQNQIKCWPSEADCKDNDGHGTHVAQLLLKIVPHADLRIAKITDSQLLMHASIYKIEAVGSFTSSITPVYMFLSEMLTLYGDK